MSQTDLKGEGSILVVFIPHDDDTFSSSSHECVHVVSTEDGDYLFNRRLKESHANTAQAAWQSIRWQCECGAWVPNHVLVCPCGESSPQLKEMEREQELHESERQQPGGSHSASS